MRTTIGYGAILVVLAACGGESMDLGSNGDGSEQAGADDASSTSASVGGACMTPQPEEPDASDVDAASLIPVSGAWSGYIESYTFPSGSDVLSLVFAIQADGSVTGTLTFGSGPPTPVPTDPDLGYVTGDGVPGNLFEAFGYTVIAPTFDGTRLRFGVQSREPYQSWCDAQTSYSWAPEAPCQYTCLPNWSGSGAMGTNGNCVLDNPTPGGANTTVDCGKFSLCLGFVGDGSPCTCDAAGCYVAMSAPDITFDMQLMSGHLDGSFQYQNTDHNVDFNTSVTAND